MSLTPKFRQSLLLSVLFSWPAFYGSLALAANEASNQNKISGPSSEYDLPRLRVKSLDLSGDSCPTQKNIWAIDDENSNKVLLSLPHIDAAFGEGIDSTKAQAKCSISMQFEQVKGWQFRVKASHIQGWATLEPGLTASIRSTFTLPGSAESLDFAVETQGPSDEALVYSDASAPTKKVWSTCHAEKTLNLVNSVQIRLGKKLDESQKKPSGTLVFDGSLELYQQSIELEWRRCSLPAPQ